MIMRTRAKYLDQNEKIISIERKEKKMVATSKEGIKVKVWLQRKRNL